MRYARRCKQYKEERRRRERAIVSLMSCCEGLPLPDGEGEANPGVAEFRLSAEMLEMPCIGLACLGPRALFCKLRTGCCCCLRSSALFRSSLVEVAGIVIFDLRSCSGCMLCMLCDVYCPVCIGIAFIAILNKSHVDFCIAVFNLPTPGSA